MAKAKVVPRQPEPAVVLMQGTDVVRTLVVGVIVGLVVVALYFALDRYVLTPILCGQLAGEGRCENVTAVANSLAVILGAAAGLFALIRQRVFRPLLVVLLALVALWQLIPTGAALNPWLLAVFAAFLYGCAYAAFAWIVQIRSFVVSLLLALALMALVYWVLVS